MIPDALAATPTARAMVTWRAVVRRSFRGDPSRASGACSSFTAPAFIFRKILRGRTGGPGAAPPTKPREGEGEGGRDPRPGSSSGPGRLATKAELPPRLAVESLVPPARGAGARFSPPSRPRRGTARRRSASSKLARNNGPPSRSNLVSGWGRGGPPPGLYARPGGTPRTPSFCASRPKARDVGSASGARTHFAIGTAPGGSSLNHR